MSYLRSLPEHPTLLDVFRAYPDQARVLLEYHELVMRGPSPLSPGERELIAAYVSGLNGCDYCHGIHTVTAEAFGVPEGLVAALLADPDTAPVDDRLRPILRYVGILARDPARIGDADADQVFARGWDDRALHDAVQVCALFSFMNRMVAGHGIEPDAAYTVLSGRRLRDEGYAGLAAHLDNEHPVGARSGGSR